MYNEYRANEYRVDFRDDMGWLRFVGSLKTYVSFAKEPYKRDYILQKRPILETYTMSIELTFWIIWGGYD